MTQYSSDESARHPAIRYRKRAIIAKRRTSRCTTICKKDDRSRASPSAEAGRGEGEDAPRGRKGNSDSINYMSGRAPEVSNVHPANKLVIGMCALGCMSVLVGRRVHIFGAGGFSLYVRKVIAVRARGQGRRAGRAARVTGANIQG